MEQVNGLNGVTSKFTEDPSTDSKIIRESAKFVKPEDMAIY